MKRFTVNTVIGFALIFALATAVCAAPSIFGPSGNIMTPDDTIVAPGGFNIAYHGIDVGGDDTLSVFAGNVGVFPNLEVGGAFATNGDDEFIINAKYRLLAETATRPAVTVGVIDLASDFTDDAGLFVLFSKSLTQVAEEITDSPSRPLRGHIGLGDGLLSSVFFALDWTFTPQLSLMLEYVSDSDFGGSLFNGGLRYAFGNGLRADLSLIDFDDLSWGISYQTLRF
jgi:hypothetical protein